MARVTIEKCLEKVGSHFDLVLMAAERAKEVSNGRKSEIVKKAIKSHVTALRELEEGTLDISKIRLDLTNNLNNIKPQEEQQVSNENAMLEEVQSSEFVHGEEEFLDEEINIFTETADDLLFNTEDINEKDLPA